MHAYKYICTYTYVLLYIHRPSLISRFQTRQAVRIGAGPYHSAATVACGQGLGWLNSLLLTTTRCNTLQLTATRYNALQHPAAYHFAAAVAAGRASDAATHYNARSTTLQHTAAYHFFYFCLRAGPQMEQHCKILEHKLQQIPCNTLQLHAAHYNILQHIATLTLLLLSLASRAMDSATHCNTLQHTHCNILQHTRQHTATHICCY